MMVLQSPWPTTTLTITADRFTVCDHRGIPMVTIGKLGPTKAEQRSEDQGQPWWRRWLG